MWEKRCDSSHRPGSLIKDWTAEDSPLMRGRGNTLLSRLPSPPPPPSPPPQERNALLSSYLREGGSELLESTICACVRAYVCVFTFESSVLKQTSASAIFSQQRRAAFLQCSLEKKKNACFATNLTKLLVTTGRKRPNEAQTTYDKTCK